MTEEDFETTEGEEVDLLTTLLDLGGGGVFFKVVFVVNGVGWGPPSDRTNGSLLTFSKPGVFMTY